MINIIVEIMAELLSMLGLATKLIDKGRLCKCTGACSSLVAQSIIGMFSKKLLGDNDQVKAALQRLDQLTTDESSLVSAEILSVVRGHESNKKVAMEGAWCLF